AAVLPLEDWQALALPLFARGRGLGVMCLGRRDRFPEDLMLLAEDIARRAALAVDNARLYHQQAVANRALQRSLLPPDLPDVPGLDYHVVYEPAGENNAVGGDFYDLFPAGRSEEHTSELQSRENLVCRLLLEKKKKIRYRLSNAYQ